jgi:hypothetical protein
MLWLVAAELKILSKSGASDPEAGLRRPHVE